MEGLASLLPLILLFVLMWFFLIRPQRKKEKQVNEMRRNVSVGDEIITIGGICAKVVKTKDETLVIQVGADRTKFEVMRWAVSKVVKASDKPVKKDTVEDDEKEAPKKSLPKRMKRLDSEVAEDIPAIQEEVAFEVSEEPKVVEE